MELIEEYRKQCVENVFNTDAFKSSFEEWKNKIVMLCPTMSHTEVFSLGDHLREIFQTTNNGAGRTQDAVSGGGSAWEGLICWYLNLCSIGRRTVIIKHKKDLIPACVSDAITVNYGNFQSNTESDLIAITFPDKSEYNEEITNLQLKDDSGNDIKLFNKAGKFNLNKAINILALRDFNELEINIIQCKTNWNDNAQIPMLWDMVYNAQQLPNNITVGKNGYSIHNCHKFTYSFVTVPSNKIDKYSANSTCVKRVWNLSGGNFWGLTTLPSVAASIKEIFTRNFAYGQSVNNLTTLKLNLSRLNSDMQYFGI